MTLESRPLSVSNSKILLRSLASVLPQPSGAGPGSSEDSREIIHAQQREGTSNDLTGCRQPGLNTLPDTPPAKSLQHNDDAEQHIEAVLSNALPQTGAKSSKTSGTRHRNSTARGFYIAPLYQELAYSPEESHRCLLQNLCGNRIATAIRRFNRNHKGRYVAMSAYFSVGISIIDFQISGKVRTFFLTMSPASSSVENQDVIPTIITLVCAVLTVLVSASLVNLAIMKRLLREPYAIITLIETTGFCLGYAACFCWTRGANCIALSLWSVVVFGSLYDTMSIKARPYIRFIALCFFFILMFAVTCLFLRVTPGICTQSYEEIYLQQEREQLLSSLPACPAGASSGSTSGNQLGEQSETESGGSHSDIDQLLLKYFNISILDMTLGRCSSVLILLLQMLYTSFTSRVERCVLISCPMKTNFSFTSPPRTSKAGQKKGMTVLPQLNIDQGVARGEGSRTGRRGVLPHEEVSGLFKDDSRMDVPLQNLEEGQTKPGIAIKSSGMDHRASKGSQPLQLLQTSHQPPLLNGRKGSQESSVQVIARSSAKTAIQRGLTAKDHTRKDIDAGQSSLPPHHVMEKDYEGSFDHLPHLPDEKLPLGPASEHPKTWSFPAKSNNNNNYAEDLSQASVDQISSMKWTSTATQQAAREPLKECRSHPGSTNLTEPSENKNTSRDGRITCTRAEITRSKTRAGTAIVKISLNSKRQRLPPGHYVRKRLVALTERMELDTRWSDRWICHVLGERYGVAYLRVRRRWVAVVDFLSLLLVSANIVVGIPFILGGQNARKFLWPMTLLSSFVMFEIYLVMCNYKLVKMTAKLFDLWFMVYKSALFKISLAGIFCWKLEYTLFFLGFAGGTFATLMLDAMPHVVRQKRRFMMVMVFIQSSFIVFAVIYLKLEDADCLNKRVRFFSWLQKAAELPSCYSSATVSGDSTPSNIWDRLVSSTFSWREILVTNSITYLFLCCLQMASTIISGHRLALIVAPMALVEEIVPLPTSEDEEATVREVKSQI